MGGHPQSLQHVHKLASHLCRLVFLDYVAAVSHYLQVELALHVSHCQLLVHTVASRQQELLFERKLQECIRQALEPLNPVWLRCHKVRAPDVLCDACWLVNDRFHLLGHTDSS